MTILAIMMIASCAAACIMHVILYYRVHHVLDLWIILVTFAVGVLYLLMLLGFENGHDWSTARRVTFVALSTCLVGKAWVELAVS